MRRQARPFVTEYKSPARRGKSSSANPFEAKADSTSDAPDEPARANWPAPKNGGYSAAHAAADALFAPSSRAGRAEAADHAPETESSAAALSAGGGTSVPPAEDDPFRAATAKLDAAGGGRILQAIEVAGRSVPEAEPAKAPRRRTRKPPAHQSGDGMVAPANPAPEAALPGFEPPTKPLQPRPARPLHPGARQPNGAPVQEAALASQNTERQDTRAERATPRAQPLRRTERFSWVRKKLRPGEQWKRRLPKVAW